MNYLDIILAIPIVVLVIRGFKKGFIIEVATLIAAVLGVWGAVHFSYFISDKLNLTSPYSPLISFTVTFIIIVIIIFLIAKLLEKTINLLALGFVNKLAGAFFGLIKIVFLLSIFLLLLDKFNLEKPVIPKETREASILYPPISDFAPYIIPKLNFEELKSKIESVKAENESEENINTNRTEENQ
jgi:membrane protein required for colicin V production